MKALAGLLVAIAAVPAHGQSFTCGPFKTEIKQTASGTEWTIARGTEKSTENGRLKSGPRFECIQGEVLVVEFTPVASKSFIGLYFPDGSDIGYSGQIARRNNRLVLPIQAKARMDAKYRAAFDYHCRLEMPGDPIAPASRADCISLK